jgi:hypothetical protein
VTARPVIAQASRIVVVFIPGRQSQPSLGAIVIEVSKQIEDFMPEENQIASSDKDGRNVGRPNRNVK